MALKIRKDDQVMVTTGKEKGKTGKVARVVPDKGVVYIEKVNMVKRHQRPSAKYKHGGIIEKEAPIKLSKLMLVCPKCSKPSRAGVRTLDDGHRVRYCKKCDEQLDS